MFVYFVIHWYPVISADAGGMLNNGDIEVSFRFKLRGLDQDNIPKYQSKYLLQSLKQ